MSPLPFPPPASLGRPAIDPRRLLRPAALVLFWVLLGVALTTVGSWPNSQLDRLDPVEAYAGLEIGR